MSKRILSPYEKNQLRRYQKSEEVFLALQTEMPIEHYTGFVDFAGLEIQVTEKVLIPRVETEELVSLMLSKIEKKEKLSYLEVGTGSGALSFAFYQTFKNHFPNYANSASFLLTDLSSEAVSLAKINLTRIFSETVKSQFSFMKTNLLKDIKERSFDIIVANLPYIPHQQLNDLEKSVSDFEPSLALDGGEDGFKHIIQLLRAIKRGDFLKPDGKIFLEVDQSHDVGFLKNHYPEVFESYLVENFLDQFERNRFIVLTMLEA